MNQEHTITLDGFLLTGTDEYGVRWSTAEVPGWHDAPPMRTDRKARSGQAGSHPAKGNPGERITSLSGMATAPDTATLERAGRRFAAVLADGWMGPLVVTSTFATLSADVAIEDAPTFRPISWHQARWAVTVAAPDQLLYGPPVFDTATLATATPGAGRVWPRVWPTDWGIPAGTTPGALVLPNDGLAAYWPRLRTDGRVLNPVITCVETGAWVRYRGDVLAGQWLDWDMASRRVLLQGQVDVRTRVSWSGDWLAVPPGGASLTWTADTADSSALLSAWGYEGAHA